MVKVYKVILQGYTKDLPEDEEFVKYVAASCSSTALKKGLRYGWVVLHVRYSHEVSLKYAIGMLKLTSTKRLLKRDEDLKLKRSTLDE